MNDDGVVRVLWVVPSPADARTLAITPCTPESVADRLEQGGFEVLVVPASNAFWPTFVDTLAVVVLADAAGAGRIAWLRAGAQDVLPFGDAVTPEAEFRIQAAVERQRLRVATRQSFATDVQTGLPHEGQLLEHMSHLLALREREPAPMALLALRIEGFSTAAARLGAEAAGALRRKVAVRLRAGVRASDVVASLGEDAFAVLLSSMEAQSDAERVASKLQAALMQPFKLGGTELALATALGIAASPADGAQPALLLRRALGLAASAVAVGRAGFANRIEGGGGQGAANDD